MAVALVYCVSKKSKIIKLHCPSAVGALLVRKRYEKNKALPDHENEVPGRLKVTLRYITELNKLDNAFSTYN